MAASSLNWKNRFSLEWTRLRKLFSADLFQNASMYIFMTFNWKKVLTAWLTTWKSKNDRLWAWFSWLIIFFSKNIIKFNLSVKNTHSLSFLKIFGNLVTKERGLKRIRSAKLWRLKSKRAALGLVVCAWVEFLFYNINE